MSSGHPKVREGKQRMQLSGVFHKPTVAHLGKSKLALDHPEGVLDLGAHTGFEMLDSLADWSDFSWVSILRLPGRMAICRLALVSTIFSTPR